MKTCDCHGEPQMSNGVGKFTCRVKKLASDRARYHRDMATPQGKAKRNAKARVQYDRRKTDPAYQLDRQLRDMTRVRVSY